MNILFICENYLPHYGGAEVVFKNLAQGYVDRNHKVTLLTHRFKGTKKHEVIGGVNVQRISSLRSRYVFSFSGIFGAIKEAKDVDVIQTTTFNGAFPAWIAGKIRRKPVVLTVHEVWVGKWRKVTDFSRFKSFIHDLLERLIYSLPFDKYVCVSNATKNDLCKLNVRKKNVTTIYNGFDYDFWDPHNFSDEKGNAIRDKLKLNGKFIFFSWGRPGTSKGHEYAIKALAKIVKAHPKAHLLLMFGSIDKYKQKYKYLLKLIKNLKVKDHVTIVPSKPYEQLGFYIKVANTVIVPSIAEGFGYSTLEAIAMKRPVIVSDAGSLPEVVSSTHLIFKNKDVYDLANKMMLAIQGKFKESEEKKFEWNRAIKGYLDLYKKITGKT